MSKIGRNDPCHCGSGKKYKKCCLNKDQQEQKEKQKYIKNPELEWLSEEFWDEEDFDYQDNYFDDEQDELEDDFYDELEDELDDEDFDDEDFDEELEDEDIEDEELFSEDTYPTISEAEEKKVDEWWEEYNIINDPIEIKKHLDDFLENNSLDTIINLGLEQEVLFELIGDYTRIGKHDEIIEYLIDFREKYPEIYEKSAGFYDYDIIIWLAINNRESEIPKYFSYFENDTNQDIEKLIEVISFLNATNKLEVIIPQLYKICKLSVKEKRDYIYDELIDYILFDFYKDYLNRESAHLKINDLITKIKEINEHFNDYYYEAGYWKDKFSNIFKSYEKWEEKIPNSKHKFLDFIIEVILNFSGYLYNTVEVSYNTANFYSLIIMEFYKHIIDSKTKPKELFIYAENQIDTLTMRMSRDIFGLNVVKAFSVLNALYYFADYLLICGNYNESEKEKLQMICEKYFKIVYDNTANQVTENKAFAKFPIFG